MNLRSGAKRAVWLAAGCLWAATAWSAEVGAPEPEAAEAIPARELRELLKEEKNAFGPVGELIFSMSEKEKAELRELYQKDRDAARKFLLDRLAEKRRDKQEQAREIQRVAKQWRQSRDDVEKEELRTRLRTLLTEQFNRLSAEIAVRLKQQEQQLERVRHAYEKRQNNAEQMIDGQLEKLLQKKGAPRKNVKP